MRHIVRANPTNLLAPKNFIKNKLPEQTSVSDVFMAVQKAKELSRGGNVTEEGKTSSTSSNTKWWVLGGVATLGVVGIAFYALKD